jgi:hypothetical protein
MVPDVDDQSILVVKNIVHFQNYSPMYEERVWAIHVFFRKCITSYTCLICTAAFHTPAVPKPCLVAGHGDLANQPV